VKKRYLLLIIIFVFAFALRFWRLGEVPPSLNWDEVALGYNAYSIVSTGKDEYGKFFPFVLRSYDDYKPALYTYFTIPTVKIFGLTPFAVRFPSAFFGVLTIIATYFLTKRLFPNSQTFTIKNLQFGIPEVAALLLAISPWHINLSRAAFEANVASFFLVLGVLLFLAWVQGKKWYSLVGSSIVLALSFYTFNTSRIVAPLLVGALGLGFLKTIKSYKKDVFVALLIGVLVLLPILPFLFSPQASLRFKEVNIFSDIGIVHRANQEIANDNGAFWSKIIHNRRVGYITEYVRHYFDNLNPRFLFIKGDGNPKFSTQDVGQLYLWELPFLIGGMLLLFRKREGYWWIIPVWMLLGIVPAATARETPHALRIETTLPTFQIATAYGLVYGFRLIDNLKHRLAGMQSKYFIWFFFFLLAILNFLYYIHGYYKHYPKEFSGEWQYGYKEAISFVKDAQSRYEKIYFTETLGRPYAYVLFYTNYDPKKFRKEAIIEREALGFVHVKSFGKYTFDKDVSRFSTEKKALFIDVLTNIPRDAKVIKTFYLLNGNPSLVAYTL